MKINEILQFYWENHGNNCANWKGIKKGIEHLGEHFGRLDHDKINQKHADSYISTRGISIGASRRELGSLKTAINYAVSNRLIDQPSYTFRLPPAPSPRQRFLSDPEVDRLLAAAKATRTHRMSRAERFACIALETGARRRSIELLTWDRVNLHEEWIDFRIPGKVQTKKRQAKVPITDELLPILKQAYKDRCSGFVLDTRSQVYSTFKTLCRSAGIEDVCPHTMRHTCATRLLKRGIDTHTVAKILGCTPELVYRVYGHSSWDDVWKAMKPSG